MSYKINILSLDTETLGLEDPNNSINQIIEFGIVPAIITIDESITLETFEPYHTFIKCPCFDDIKDDLSEWVRDNNKELINDAYTKGISDDEFKNSLSSFLKYTKKLFNSDTIIYLGKSMQSLDSPIMTKHLGWEFMDKWSFNRKKIDVQDVARFLVHQGKLPLDSVSSKSLVSYFNIKNDVNHTVIDDSIDMLKIYVELLKL